MLSLSRHALIVRCVLLKFERLTASVHQRPLTDFLGGRLVQRVLDGGRYLPTQGEVCWSLSSQTFGELV
jgi:hypothetical protein